MAGIAGNGRPACRPQNIASTGGEPWCPNPLQNHRNALMLLPVAKRSREFESEKSGEYCGLLIEVIEK
jgi:hypothetical protein